MEGDTCCLLTSVLPSFIVVLQGVPNPDALLVVVESGDEDGEASDAGDAGDGEAGGAEDAGGAGGAGDAGDAGGDVFLLIGEEKSSSWSFNKSRTNESLQDCSSEASFILLILLVRLFFGFVGLLFFSAIILVMLFGAGGLLILRRGLLPVGKVPYVS